MVLEDVFENEKQVPVVGVGREVGRVCGTLLLVTELCAYGEARSRERRRGNFIGLCPVNFRIQNEQLFLWRD